MPAFDSVPPNWDIREGLECAERCAIYQAMNLQARVIPPAGAVPSISPRCHIGVVPRGRATAIVYKSAQAARSPKAPSETMVAKNRTTHMVWTPIQNFTVKRLPIFECRSACPI
jgi:hypothetical protein